MQGTQVTTRRGTVDVHLAHLVIIGGRMDIHETFSFMIGADAVEEQFEERDQKVDAG
jgi:hypothetical protein